MRKALQLRLIFFSDDSKKIFGFIFFGSDAPETAEFELNLWFGDTLMDWNQDSINWVSVNFYGNNV